MSQPNPEIPTQTPHASPTPASKPPAVAAVAVRGLLFLGVVLYQSYEFTHDRSRFLVLFALFGSIGLLASVIQLIMIFAKRNK